MYAMVLDPLLVTSDSQVTGIRLAQTSVKVTLFAYADDVTVTDKGCEPLYGLTEMQHAQY